MDAKTVPIVREAEFEAVDTSDTEEIRRRFGTFVTALHAYLNEMDCLKDVQKTRLKWKRQVREKRAFGNPIGVEPRHWYTYHNGGRGEAQFNVGLFRDHLRVGLGFEFTAKEFGDPAAVQIAYACFLNLIRSSGGAFEQFVEANRLSVGWVPRDGILGVVETGRAVSWLLNPPKEPQWIFVGRILWRQRDAAVLESEQQLGKVFEDVLCGFRPTWEQVQLMAR